MATYFHKLKYIHLYISLTKKQATCCYQYKNCECFHLHLVQPVYCIIFSKLFFADDHHKAESMGTHSLYATLSGPSHYALVTRIQGPTCVDL